jgi:hypothetical protein
MSETDSQLQTSAPSYLPQIYYHYHSRVCLINSIPLALIIFSAVFTYLILCYKLPRWWRRRGPRNRRFTRRNNSSEGIEPSEAGNPSTSEGDYSSQWETVSECESACVTPLPRRVVEREEADQEPWPQNTGSSFPNYGTLYINPEPDPSTPLLNRRIQRRIHDGGFEGWFDRMIDRAVRAAVEWFEEDVF